jgi:hypothetical protein
MPIAPTASVRKLFDTGVRDHIDLMIEVTQPADATAELFHRYITEVFFPALEGLSTRRRVQKRGFMNRQFFKRRYLKILRQQRLD